MTEALPTVFVVDDDAAVRKSLARLLKSAGYHTESFASADEFLEHWRNDPIPGCVLLDILMPGLDGLQLQQKLNKQIAAALGASEKTVKIHRGRVMEKMNVQSVADLVRAGQKIGPI
jgi:FixJ family two-component response regulator